jgi:hypothetical protein
VKSSHLAAGLVGLAIVGLWFVGGGTQPLPGAQASDAPRVGSPQGHENLTVYFLYGSDAMPDAKVLSLPEALERELAVVHETSNVNLLAVENKSGEYELFIQSGDIVKGGRQDRMVQHDMLLPPKSGVVAMPAHCVEQGRWTNRGGEDARRFASSTKSAVGNEMKFANYSGQQSEVWKTVGENQTKINAGLMNGANVQAAASPTSFQLSLESPELLKKVAEYEAALKAAGEGRDDIVGVVFAVNGNVTGAEVYGANAIFRKAWPKLLNSAAVEAVAERTGKPAAAAPSARAVELFLASAAEPQTIIANGDIAWNTNEDPGLESNLEASALRLSLTGDRGRQVAETWLAAIARNNAPPPPPQFANAPAPAPQLSRIVLPAPNPPGVAGTGGTADVIQEVADLLEPAPAPPPPAANPNGNRLITNANVNPSSLMVESRDPTRANAIIHRSYLKR